jgi:Cu(I)/Ag(I) efflux system membrane fusion protein
MTDHDKDRTQASPNAVDAPPGTLQHSREFEHPPRGVRVMAVFRWVLIAAMAVVATLSVTYSFGLVSTGSASASAKQYYCPMHPQVVQDHPGECPICSMSLVPKPGSGDKSETKGDKEKESDPYYCPMHPEETGTNPNARCPICEMKLEKRPPAPKTGSTQAPIAPTAPVTEPTPGHPQGVPGLVPVELGLDRVQLIGVRTARATAEVLVPELRTIGVVAADEARLARVHSRFSGWVENLAVATTGQKVRRGQVLAGLYNLELAPAQQEFLAARRWSSTAAPAASGISPTTGALEQDARARLELFGMSRAEIDAIAKTGKPARTIAVSAPIAGYVVRKSAVRGTYVQPGTELFEIADLSKVWVLVDVYEYEISRVSIGQSVDVLVSAYPKERFSGKVGFIYPTVDPATRTLRIRVELPNKDLKLRPGMYGDVVIHLESAQGVVVPAEALVDTGEYQYVFLAKEGGRFEPRRVRVGARSGSKLQILEGLAPGDSVVTTANFLIDSESRLRAAIEGTSPQPGR